MSMAHGQDGAGPGSAPASSSRLWWGWFVLAVLYLLSIGPAGRLHQACPPLRQPIEAVYLPITALCDRVPPFKSALQWYLVEVWGYPYPVPK